MDSLRVSNSSGGTKDVSRGRRLDERYPAYFDLVVTDLPKGQAPANGFMVSISPQGVCVMLPTAVGIGAFVKVRVGETVFAGDVVSSRRQGNSFRTGIRVRPQEGGEYGIAELLRSMLIEPGTRRRPVSRRHLRYLAHGALRVHWRDGNRAGGPLRAQIRDCSEGGAKLRVNEKIPVRSELRCEDQRPGIGGAASVRYCQPVEREYDIGLEFEGHPWNLAANDPG